MIHFKRLRFKNILSFGNTFTEIVLDSYPSTIIQGVNGSGKSTILDTLTYALYGKPFRKINKPAIINSRNKKEMICEIEFSINTAHFKVVRGQNPAVFEIWKDGDRINQNAASRDYQEVLEKQILKIDFQAFTQIVILGKATYVSFLRLQAGERRKFIESILGLDIFSKMNEVHKARYSLLKQDILSLKTEITIHKEKISVRERYLHDLKEDRDRSARERQRKLNEDSSTLKKDLDEYDEELMKLRESKITIDIKSRDDLRKKSKKIQDLISKMNLKKDQIRTNLEFFVEQDLCPTCKQSITEELKSSKLKELENRVQEFSLAGNKLESELLEVTDSLKIIEKNQENNQIIEQRIQHLGALAYEKERQLNQLNSVTFEASDDQVKIDSETENLRLLHEEYERLIERKSDLLETLNYYEIISSLLKDSGIKATIIQKYIPIISEIINTNLRQLGFFVKLELSENFEERILVRGIDELSFHNFSEGEKLRIDMAVLLAWREISKLQNSMSTNLIIFDEILDGSADAEGTDMLLKMITSIKDTNMFLISHSPERWNSGDKFTNSLLCRKDSGFSKIISLV